MRKPFASALLLALAISMSGTTPVSAEANSRDFTGSTEYHLVPCLTKTELDCVESFGFINRSGAYVVATATTTQLTTFVGQNDNPVKQQQSNWTAVVDGKPLSATLDVPLQSPKYVIYKTPDGAPHYGSSLRPSIYSPDLLNLHVRLKIRTSFLIPQNVQLVAENSDFLQTKIAGGNLWMFEGRGTPVSNYTDYSAPSKRDFSAKADEDSATLHFIIHHGDPDLSRGYWPAQCGDKGYTVQAFNSNSAGSPSWNAQEQSLDFAIQSPHTKANGTANTGFFKLWTTDEYIDCKWPGNALSKSPRLEVRIISEDGETQTSINEVLHKDGKIFVSASGFHYSKPTIKLVPANDSTPAQTKPSTPTATPTTSPKPIVPTTPKPKLLTVTCIKGKTLKKVTGTAPKCPAGFKLKK
jgi:hypothetical protein